MPACVTPEPADAPPHGAHAQSRPALPRHRPLLQAARRGAAHPLGLRLLPDAARDQLSVLQDRQRPLGRRGPQAEQLRRHRHDRRRRARRQLPRRIERRAGADAAPDRLLRRAGGETAGAAHARETGRHHRAVAGAAPAGAVRRPHQPLGRRPQLRHVDRVGCRSLPPGQLHGNGRAAAPVRRRHRGAALPAAARGSPCRSFDAPSATDRTNAAAPVALLRRLHRQLRRPGRASDPLGVGRLGQLHGAAGRGGAGAAAGRRLHQDARAQRPDDRPLPLARARVRCAPSSFAQGHPEPAVQLPGPFWCRNCARSS